MTGAGMQVVKLMQAGKLKVVLAEVLPLEQAAKAHELSEAGHVRGKLVLRMGTPPAS